MKPEGMRQDIYERYQKDGFSESDIERIWQDTLYFRSKMAEKKEAREITSSTYERAQKKLNQEVANWIGRR